MSRELDELGQAPFAGGLELAHVLAQLGRDPGIAEPLVHRLLGPVREDLAGLRVLDAVLGDRHLLADGLLTESDVVGLRAREVLQQVPVRIGRNDAEVEPQALVRDDGRLRVPLRHDLVDPRKLREVLGQRGGIARRGDDVEVAYLLLEAADAAGLAHLVGGGMLAQDLDDSTHRRQSAAEQRLLLDLLARRRESAQDVLLGLRPEPGERPQLLGLGGLLQALERRDVELLPDAARGLRAEPRQVHELDDVGRDALLALRERLDLAVLDDLDDLLLDRLADPGQLLRLSLDGELRDRAARLAHALRRAAVGERPELVAALELEKVGQQVELVGDLGVPGKRLRHARDDMQRAHPHLPADVQRAREPRGDGAGARRPRPRGARGARDRRRLAGRDRGDRGPARGRAALGARAAPRAKGGPRPRVPGRVPARPRARRRPRPRDGLRLLARPGGRASPRRCRRRRRSRPRLALRRREAARATGGSSAASSRAAARCTRRCCSSSASAT